MIRRLHGAEPTHVESVPVKETFGGQTVWDGIVEVFELRGHPKANRVYAWSHDTDETILNLAPGLRERELAADPNRSSSGLTERGGTRPEDEL